MREQLLNAGLVYAYNTATGTFRGDVVCVPFSELFG